MSGKSVLTIALGVAAGFMLANFVTNALAD